MSDRHFNRTKTASLRVTKDTIFIELIGLGTVNFDKHELLEFLSDAVWEIEATERSIRFDVA